MPVPNLLHPARITLLQKAATPLQMDDEAREPIQSVGYSLAVSLAGQPKFKSLGLTENATPGGSVITTEGYVLFRYVDLNALTITLRHGDRITAIGHLSVDIYIYKLEPTAPYPDQNGFSMVKAHCRDRSPSRGVASP